MAVVLLLGVGFAGLRAASFLWASALFTLTVMLLAAAILAAIVCRGPSRAAWLGFGLFGWTYLLATFWLWPERNGVSAPPFLTKPLMDVYQPSWGTVGVRTFDPGPQGEMSNEPPPKISFMAPGTIVVTTTPFTGRSINLLHYRRIGQTLAAIVFGLLGAVMGAVYSAWAGSAESPHPEGEPPRQAAG
jgi:hypothetical protein